MNLEINTMKKIIEHEHNSIIQAIRDESQVADFSHEFQRMHLNYITELHAITGRLQLDKFLLNYRGLSLDEWINTLNLNELLKEVL